MDEFDPDFLDPWLKLFVPLPSLPPGVPLKTAIERLEQWEGKGRGKKAAVTYLQSGVWNATCQRGYLRHGVLKFFDTGDLERKLNELDKSYVGHSRLPLKTSRLAAGFWNNCHIEAGIEWAARKGFMFPDAARVDLGRGLIETFTGFFEEGTGDDEFRAVFATAFGVHINEHDVEAVAPEKGSQPPIAKRATLYDWEVSFADVAAEFYHGAEFDNLDARGVQSEVVKMLRASFETRGLAVPSDETLKPKARMLLGALRAKKP